MLNILRNFIPYYKPHIKIFIIDMLCAFLLALLSMFFPIMIRSIINDFVPNNNLRMFLIFSVSLLIIYVVKSILVYIIQYWGHLIGVRIQADIRQKAFEHLQKLPFSYFDKTKSGTIMSRIINDTLEISELSHHGPEDLFISCITMLGAFVFLSTINFWLTLIIFACVPFLVCYSIKKRIKLSESTIKARVKIGEVNAELENNISGIRVSKAYGAAAHEKAKFQNSCESFSDAMNFRYRIMAQFFSSTGLFIDLMMLIAIVSASLFVFKGIITIGDFTVYLLFVNLFIDPINRLINLVDQFQDGMAGFSRILELFDEKPEEDAPNSIILEDVQGHILFKNITFSYKNSEPIFEKLTLDIKSGQTIALVGFSGEGKSTLCHLLLKFYDLQVGAIYIDNVNIDKISRLSLRKKIGIVQQDTFLFTGTIRENIAYGDFSASDSEIVESAKKAGIHDFIMSLPEKYDTYVGVKGVMLSGGQKQRISIARVFLKNPPILILDEATSALDNATERTIQTAIDKLKCGRTTIVIAHRLSTIKNVDTINVISEKGIVEQGSHDELLMRKGFYHKLWNLIN